MLKVAIVEDDLQCAGQLQAYMEKYVAEQGLSLELTRFSDGMELAQQYRPVWDLILLDIEMPRMDGMEAATRVRQVDPEVQIIFITNMARFAVRGYQVDALDFVLKPITYPKLALRLRKAVEIIQQRTERFLLVSSKEALHKLPISQIRYIEVANRHLHIHTADREYLTNGTLSALEKELAGSTFARCGHSYLVNLRHVTAVHRDTVLLGEMKVPLSRSCQKEFLQRLTAFVGGNGR